MKERACYETHRCPCYYWNKTWWFIPTSQLSIKDFAEPFRLDGNRNGRGVMIYIRDDSHSRLLSKHVFPSDTEGLYIEINFRKCKWLLLGTYHPPSQSDQYYFNNLDKSLDTYSNYEKTLLVGDLKGQTTDHYLIYSFININYRV